MINKNMGNLLNDYLNPSLNSVTNQAKMKSFTNTLNSESAKTLENNIINPLSQRNMVRSSQATNMYNNLAKNNANNIANYANELLSTSQDNSANMLKTLMALYMNGYNVLAANQSQSLNTSQGNATKTQTTKESGVDMNQLIGVAAQLALNYAVPGSTAAASAIKM